MQLEERVIPIDYEYCAYNYRAFDLANHFSEWMYDYSHGEYPFYRRTRRFFPDKERQVSEMGMGGSTHVVLIKFWRQEMK